MKYAIICQNKDAMRHMKKAHQFRAMLKRGDQGNRRIDNKRTATKGA